MSENITMQKMRAVCAMLLMVFIFPSCDNKVQWPSVDEDIVNFPDNDSVEGYTDTVDITVANDEDVVVLNDEDTVEVADEDTVVPAEKDIIEVADEDAVVPAEKDIIEVVEEDTVIPVEEDVIEVTDEDIIVPTEKDAIEAADEDTIIPVDEDTIANTLCGNGVIDGDEECDETPTECLYNESCQSCSEECIFVAGKTPHCGDGVVQSEHEQCEVGDKRNCTAIEPELYIGGIAECKGDCSGYMVASCSTVPGWSAVAAGALHSCGIYEGGLYCWGANFAGQLGEGSFVDKITPVHIGVETDWSVISAGDLYTCGIRSGELYCWGRNTSGQLGDGTTVEKNIPVRIGGTHADWSTVSAGYQHTCAIRSGEIYCWGEYIFGETMSSEILANPTKIDTASTWSSVAAGRSFACGIKAGNPYCWGSNALGQIGDGTGVDKNTPTIIDARNNWFFIYAGDFHACGIRAGSLYCWGNNNVGQLGDNTTGSKLFPTLIDIATNWSSVAAGSGHTCGIQGGALYCWGNNEYGKLGNGTGAIGSAVYITAPSRVGAETGWSAIDADDYHTCGIRTGKLYCWGYNNYGQLGKGASGEWVYKNTPVLVVDP